jgi:dipeptidyl aminopeptidase
MFVFFSHFISTERSPHERHLYTISLKSKELVSTKACITCPEDPEEHAYYSTSFSPKSGYYILNYEGPGIPNTVVKKVDDPSFRSVLQDNSELRTLLQGYQLPKTHLRTINSGGVGRLLTLDAIRQTALLIIFCSNRIDCYGSAPS